MQSLRNLCIYYVVVLHRTAEVPFSDRVDEKPSCASAALCAMLALLVAPPGVPAVCARPLSSSGPGDRRCAPSGLAWAIVVVRLGQRAWSDAMRCDISCRCLCCWCLVLISQRSVHTRCCDSCELCCASRHAQRSSPRTSLCDYTQNSGHRIDSFSAPVASFPLSHTSSPCSTMGDREIAVPNRTVHNRWMRHLAGLHSERLEHMKSTLPQDPPPTFDFLSQRSKRNQAFMTRASAIERENLILLDKMRGIMSTKQMLAETSEPFLKESLNRERRKKDMIRIMNENEALLRRIQSRRPVYEVALFEKAHAQKEYLLSRVGKFPYVSDSAPEATPPPLANNQLVYFGYKGKANAMAQRRLTAGAAGGTATLPKIASVTATSGSQTARPPKSASAAPVSRVAAASSSRSPATSRPAAASSTPASPAPPAGPATASIRSNKIRGNKALVYSGQELDIDGVRCQLSVFEKAAVAATKSSAGLEFQAVDPPAHTSTALPIFYSFQALTAAFGAKDGSAAAASEEKSADASGSSIPLSFFSQPDKTRELIMTYLLPKLAWRPSGAGDDKRQLYMRGVEEEKSAAAAPRKQQAKGPQMYVRVHLEARGLPADQTSTDPVAVMYAQNEQTHAYQQIAHTTLRRSAATGSASAAAVHKGSVIVPYHARVDGPLRLGIFAVDPATKAVLPTACLGETKFGIQPMLSSEELVVRLIKNSGKNHANTKANKKEAAASAEASVRITHSPASSANEGEEQDEPEQKQESTEAVTKKPAASSSVLGADSDDDDADDDAPKKKKAAVKKLFTGGRAISGVEFLVRGVDGSDVPVSERPAKLAEPHALLFQLYFRPTSLTLDHAVSKAELPALRKLLASPPAEGATLAEQAEELQSLFTATQHDGETPAVRVQFNGEPLVAWKDLAVFKPAAAAASVSAAGSKSSSVKSSPKTSPRSSTANLAAAAKTPAKKPATTAKKTDAAAADSKSDAKPDAKAEAAPKAEPAKKKALTTKTSSVASTTANDSAADEPTKPAESKQASAEPKPAAAAVSPKSSSGADKSTPASPSSSSKEATKPAAAAVAPGDSTADSKAVAAAAAAKPARPSSAADLDVDLGDLDDLDDEPAAAKPAVAEKKPVAAAAAPQKTAEDTKPAAAATESKAYSTEADDAAAGLAAKKKEEEAAAAAAAKKKSEDEAAAKKNADEAAAAAAEAAKAAEKKKQDDEAAAAKAKADAAAAAAAKAKAAEDEKAAEEKKKSEEAAAAAAAAKAAELAASEAAAKEAADKQAAEAKRKSEEDAAAAAAKKKGDDDAAAAAKAADLAAKQEARKAKKAEEKAAAAAAVRAAVEAEAKAALAKGPTPITLSMRVSCTGLPAHAQHATLSPMVAMYAESLSGEYGFCSQTERVDPTPNNAPEFATALSFETDANTPAAAVMFSVYHVVEGAALSENDMVGQALSTQADLVAAMERKQELKLPIQSGGVIVPEAFLTLRGLASTPGHASKQGGSASSASSAAAGGATAEYDVYVSCCNLERKGHASVSPMVALYAANESGEYGYVLQTERLESVHSSNSMHTTHPFAFFPFPSDLIFFSDEFFIISFGSAAHSARGVP